MKPAGSAEDSFIAYFQLVMNCKLQDTRYTAKFETLPSVGGVGVSYG